jgi:peptide/nickel transport system substrate-binding protein
LEWALLVLAIIMLSITQAFLYAESYAVTAFTSGGTYSEATLGRINSLNPLFATTSSEKTLSRLMFLTLSSVDYSGHMGLGLADSIKTDDTGTVWTVSLRKGLSWSDGEPITNRDVIYTVGILQSPAVISSYSSNLSGVILTESGEDLVFTLSTPYANFSSALEFPILPAHILENVAPNLLLEDSFSSSPITSGAFSYKASQSIGSLGEKIVYLSPNKDYYEGSPLLDSFAVHAYLDTEDIISALNSGSVTATAELLPTDAEKITSSSIYEKQTALNSGVFIFFNTTNSVFANKNLRNAVRQGIDMRSLRAPVGDEADLDYPFLPTQLELEDMPTLPDYNPDAAKEVIKKAELDKDRPIRLATINTGYFPALAENLKFQLENLGFSVTTDVMTPDQDFLVNVIRPRNYDILLYEIELGSDPDLFAYYHSSQVTENGLNLSNYNNTFASDAILAARRTIDPTLRNTKYMTFLKHWVEDVPAIGLYQVNLSYFVNKNVRSFSEDNRLVTPTDRFEDVIRWATEKTSKNRTP